MFEKEIERKLKKEQKEIEKHEKRKRGKQPSYKGYDFRNWLVYPIGVLEVELELAKTRKYKALEFTEQKATEIINKYLVDVCGYDATTGELSFSTSNYNAWEQCACTKDKLWCRKFRHELGRFLRDTYECTGFVKTIEQEFDSEWVIFTRIK